MPNAASFGAEPMNSVIGVGAPWEVSGSHMWNGAAPNLNAMPTTMNTTPVSISTRSSPTSPPARSWLVARSSEYVAPYSSDMPNSSRHEASEPRTKYVTAASAESG